MDYTEEQMSLAFDGIPRSTQDVLFTPEIEKQVQAIGAPLSVLTGGMEELNALVNMAILKLADEKEFVEKLVAQLKINNDVAQKIASDVFLQIINPIRSKEKEEEKAQAEALEKAKAEEEIDELVEEAVEVENAEKETTHEEVSPVPLAPNVPRAPQLSGIAPDNLPVAEPPEYLIPPLSPKPAHLEAWPPSDGEESAETAHPFEEKMKRVFTAGQQSMGELTLEPVAPPIPVPNTARLSHDPYREAIE